MSSDFAEVERNFDIAGIRDIRDAERTQAQQKTLDEYDTFKQIFDVMVSKRSLPYLIQIVTASVEAEQCTRDLREHFYRFKHPDLLVDLENTLELIREKHELFQHFNAVFNQAEIQLNNFPQIEIPQTVWDSMTRTARDKKVEEMRNLRQQVEDMMNEISQHGSSWQEYSSSDEDEDETKRNTSDEKLQLQRGFHSVQHKQSGFSSRADNFTLRIALNPRRPLAKVQHRGI